ncbi:hypothetical protein PLICRDRAFT_467507 [Plicaturopsis crispa FD-325 SS-3]|nr:hypothetical protein PLICRDRAFT_467507 [Plicaturopsis crispa FD-325 SS-3]
MWECSRLSYHRRAIRSFSESFDLSVLVGSMGCINQPLVLKLSSDDPSYTSLIAARPGLTCGAPGELFRSRTEYRSTKHPVTTITDASGQPVASLERHELLSDVVIAHVSGLGAPVGRRIRLSSWMQMGIVKRSICHFEDGDGRRYEWRGYACYKDLQLWAADTPSHPIAYFTKKQSRWKPPAVAIAHRTYAIADLTASATSSTDSIPGLLRMPSAVSPAVHDKRSTLTLEPRAREIQDLVVTSFIFLERNRRLKESAQHMNIML